MISAARAFELAHQAIEGEPFHDAPCDVVIDRDADVYTVRFSPPGSLAVEESTRVLVDALSAAVRQVLRAESHAEVGVDGRVSCRRALQVALATLHESGAEHDPNWTTTVELHGNVYHVTFPLPEQIRAVPRRPDFALQVLVGARNGEVMEVRHAS